MRLLDLTIENFRGIRSLQLPLDPLTVLIGENNTGKSTVMEAVRLVLARGFGSRRDARFTDYDFHLGDASATPQAADPISIILHFAEERENDWPDPIVQRLGDVIQLDANGLNHIWLRSKGSYSTDSGTFEANLAFLNEAQAELVLKNTTPLNLLPRFVPLFFLSALRDASQEFGQRGQFWSGFLKSIELPEDKRKEIENTLRDVNTSLIAANAALAEVTKALGDAGKHVPLAAADPVVLEAIPTRVFDMVGKIQVHLKSALGAKLPLQRHGEGTQSLAVLMLFQAFAAATLSEAYEPESTPILALEEPEAHLHPCAIRSFGTYLNDLLGQILVSSHSGDLVSRVPITALRRLYKRQGGTHLGRVLPNAFNDDERRTVDYYIRLSRGHFLFSKAWMLVEGQSDLYFLPFLFEIMGHSVDQSSTSIIEYSQWPGKCDLPIRLAKALGIEWFLTADGDSEGQRYITRASAHLNAGENQGDRMAALPSVDIEHEFWNNGYKEFIEGLVPFAARNQARQNGAGDQAKLTKALIASAITSCGSKPAFAQTLAAEISNRGQGSIPATLQAAITRVVQLAQG